MFDNYYYCPRRRGGMRNVSLGVAAAAADVDAAPPPSLINSFSDSFVYSIGVLISCIIIQPRVRKKRVRNHVFSRDRV